MQRPFVLATISEKIPSNHGREDFVPITLETLDEKLVAKPVPYKSGLIALLSESDGYIRISRLAEGLDADTEVKVYRY